MTMDKRAKPPRRPFRGVLLSLSLLLFAGLALGQVETTQIYPPVPKIKSNLGFSPDGEHFCFLTAPESLPDPDLFCSSVSSPGPATRPHDYSPGENIFAYRFDSSGTHVYFQIVGATGYSIHRVTLGDPQSTVQMTSTSHVVPFLGEWVLAEEAGVLIYVGEVGGDLGVFAVDLDSPGQSTVLSPPSVDLPRSLTLSSDQEFVVFRARKATAYFRVYSAEIATGIEQSLSLVDNVNVGRFEITADNQRTVYSLRDRLYSVPIGGGVSEEISWPTATPTASVFSFTTSPSGARVAFLGQPVVGGMSDDVLLYDAPVSGPGETLELLTAGNDSLTNLLASDFPLEYLADDSRILVGTYFQGAPIPTFDIVTVPTDGNGPLAVLPQSNSVAGRYDWVPELGKIVYGSITNQTRGLRGISPDGSSSDTYFLGGPSSFPIFQGYSRQSDRLAYFFDSDPSAEVHRQASSVLSDGSDTIALSIPIETEGSEGIEGTPALVSDERALVFVEKRMTTRGPPAWIRDLRWVSLEDSSGSYLIQSATSAESGLAGAIFFWVSPAAPGVVAHVTEDDGIFLSKIPGLDLGESVFENGFENP